MFKKVIVVVAMMLFAGIASADVIGVFADQQAATCTINIMPYAPVDIYIMAVLTETFDGGITAAEFKVDNWLGNPGYPTGSTTVYPTSDLVIGGLGTDYSIAWSTPEGAGNGLVLIARVNVLMFNAGWIGPDYMLRIVEGDDCLCLVTVDDLFETHVAQGGLFWFNCTNPELCICLEETATQDSSWSAVKSLF